MTKMFTDRVRRIMNNARELAFFCNQEHLGTEHILTAFCSVPGGVGWTALQRKEADGGHLLLGLLAEEDSTAAQVLTAQDVTRDNLLPKIRRLYEETAGQAKSGNHGENS